MSLRSLEGHRVLELGSYIASPYAGHLLSHLGADVIKVEPFGGDPTRALFHGTPGGTFIAFSHGKRSICINLASSDTPLSDDGAADGVVLLEAHAPAIETIRKAPVTAATRVVIFVINRSDSRRRNGRRKHFADRRWQGDRPPIRGE